MKRTFITTIVSLVLFLLPVYSYGHSPAQPQPDGEPGKPCPDPRCCTTTPGGAPLWMVNPINTNLYVVDTPLWYSPAVGPSVRAEMSYNTMVTATGDEIFGNKWMFSYSGYLQSDTSGNITITMSDGRKDEFTVDTDGNYSRSCSCSAYFELEKINDTKYELSSTSGKTYTYSAPAALGDRIFLSEIRDAHNQSLTIDYTNNQLTSLTDAVGKVTTLHYNTEGLVEKITDPFGREALFAYDSERNLISLTDIGGYETTVEYSAGSMMSALVNQGGRTEFYIEPATKTPTWIQYPAPGAAMGVSSRITITNPDGQKEEYYYNAVNTTFWHVAPGDYRDPAELVNNLSSEVPKTVYTYANTVKGIRADIGSINYPGGERKIYTYDSTTGRVTRIADAAGNIRQITYNDMGQIETRTAPNGRLTSYIYDTNGTDLIGIIDDLGAISMTYDDNHQVASSTNRNSKTTLYEYNTFGQLKKITDPLNRETLLSYNSDQRLSQVSIAGEVISTLTYDNIGRTKTSLDATGLLLSYGYDNLNHLTTVTYPDGKTEIYEYNSPHSPNLQTATIDRAGRKSRLNYNQGKELASSINPEEGVSGFKRDANGNVIAFVDPNSNSTLFDYDSGNRLIKRTYADGKSLTYSYYNTGLLHKVTNSRGQITTYYYDENGNLLTVDYSDNATHDVFYTYDTFDRLTQVEDGSGITVFTYDSASRIETVDGPWENDTLTYSYDDLDRITSVQLQNGRTRTYVYDTLGRLKKIQVGTEEFTYEYEDAKSPLIKKLIRPNGSSTGYNYDTLNRLLEVANSNDELVVLSKFEYRYNDQDQRDRETITGALAPPAPTEGLTQSEYNNVNQLLENSDPAESFIYDNDGNMVQGYTQAGYPFTAVYDQEDRLASLSFTDSDGLNHVVRYTYRYDSFLVRIEKLENDVLASDTRIIRNGRLAAQERDGNNSVIREYIWGKNLGGGIGGLLQLSEGESDYFYLYDGKGNVTSLLDNTGSTVAQYRYDSFGKLVTTTGSLEQPFQFSTKRYDPDTGLNYYGYRFYNPSIERWMNRDPLGEAGGINLYGFVQNNPVNWIDPWGLEVIIIPTPLGPIPMPILPPVTHPGYGQPFMPPNLPDFDPDPGGKFKLCMELCKEVLNKATGCPRPLGNAPCLPFCLASAFLDDQSSM